MYLFKYFMILNCYKDNNNNNNKNKWTLNINEYILIWTYIIQSKNNVLYHLYI